MDYPYTASIVPRSSSAFGRGVAHARCCRPRRSSVNRTNSSTVLQATVRSELPLLRDLISTLRVMGVLDATVSVPAAEPLLGRPAIEGIAPRLVRIGPRTICMEVPFDTIGTVIGPVHHSSQLARCSPRPWPL